LFHIAVAISLGEQHAIVFHHQHNSAGDVLALQLHRHKTVEKRLDIRLGHLVTWRGRALGHGPTGLTQRSILSRALILGGAYRTAEQHQKGDLECCSKFSHGPGLVSTGLYFGGSPESITRQIVHGAWRETKTNGQRPYH